MQGANFEKYMYRFFMFSIYCAYPGGVILKLNVIPHDNLTWSMTVNFLLLSWFSITFYMIYNLMKNTARFEFDRIGK